MMSASSSRVCGAVARRSAEIRFARPHRRGGDDHVHVARAGRSSPDSVPE